MKFKPKMRKLASLAIINGATLQPVEFFRFDQNEAAKEKALLLSKESKIEHYVNNWRSNLYVNGELKAVASIR